MADNPKTSNNQNQGQNQNNNGQGQNQTGQDHSRSKGGQASQEAPQNTDESQGDMTGNTTEI